MVPANARQVPIILALALLLTLLASAPLAAQTPCDSHAGRLADIHSREQLRALVACAAQHIETVGWEQAAQDFESNDWWDHPVYIFATRADGTALFSPGSDIAPGDNLWDWQDPDGVYPSREQVRVSRDFGGGYVYLRFFNPDTGREDPMETWVQLIDYQGEPAYVGAALYPQDTHGSCPPDTVRAALVYSERDVERFVRCAEHHLQREGLRALNDFNTDPRWTSGPTYLFLIDMQTLIRAAHGGDPRLVGVEAGTQPDPDGIYFAREMRRVLNAHDDGYFYYRRLNPASGAVERKVSYVRRATINGRDYLLGAGLYVPADDCRNLPLARDVDTRDELEQYVRCAAQLVAGRGELAWELFLNHPQWIGGPTYVFVLDDQCRQLVYPLDYERQENEEPRCHVTDANGFPVNAEARAITRSEAGEGWVEYVWLNPVSDEVETKLSFVIGETLDGEPVTIGAGLYESDVQQDG